VSVFLLLGDILKLLNVKGGLEMERVSDERFIKMAYDKDKIVAMRVKNGDFHFLAWMENAEHYKIQKTKSDDGYRMTRDLLIDGDIYREVTNTKEYNNMLLLYRTDDEGHLVNKDESRYSNAYEEFLTLVKCYERNGVSDEADHDILVLTKNELSTVCDLLRDGDYVLIITDL
jgi:hypothetical protein